MDILLLILLGIGWLLCKLAILLAFGLAWWMIFRDTTDHVAEEVARKVREGEMK